ncbi:MAG: MBL fold metallo-hydrolase [Halobacteriales archaeon]|nr:MBL fold metallo-hydrolase [Halobacteriales archaeon]
MLKVSQHAQGEVTRLRMARTLLGKPMYITSCYRIGKLLVDAGCTRAAHELRSALAHDEPRTILVTHGHEDHLGNCGAFRAAASYGAAGLGIARDIPFYRNVAWGEPNPGTILPVGDGKDEGELQFLPFPTPGHTPDHLAYWVPERGWLFAGDAALGPLKYGFRDESIADYLASLKAMRDRKPTLVFPSHGPVMEDPQEQLGAQIAHLEGLRDAVRKLAREGKSDRAIALRVLGPPGALGVMSLGEFSKERLVRGLRRL